MDTSYNKFQYLLNLSDIRGYEKDVIVPTVDVVHHPDDTLHKDWLYAGYVVINTTKDGDLRCLPIINPVLNTLPKRLKVKEKEFIFPPEIIDGKHYVKGRAFTDTPNSFPGADRYGTDFFMPDGSPGDIQCVNRRRGIFRSGGVDFFSRTSALLHLYEVLGCIELKGKVYVTKG